MTTEEPCVLLQAHLAPLTLREQAGCVDVHGVDVTVDIRGQQHCQTTAVPARLGVTLTRALDVLRAARAGLVLRVLDLIVRLDAVVGPALRTGLDALLVLPTVIGAGVAFSSTDDDHLHGAVFVDRNLLTTDQHAEDTAFNADALAAATTHQGLGQPAEFTATKMRRKSAARLEKCEFRHDLRPPYGHCVLRFDIHALGHFIGIGFQEFPHSALCYASFKQF